MVILSILLPVLIGLCILLIISRFFYPEEYLGLSFPIGIGVITLGMFLMDQVLGIRLSPLSVLCLCTLIVLTLGAFVIYYGNWKKIRLFQSQGVHLWRSINPATIIPLGVIVYMVYGISSKALYWPPIHYDTIAGYDFLARAIAYEGTFLNNIFTVEPRPVSVRMTYTPLFPLGMSYFLIMGFTISKVIQPLFLISLTLTTFGFFRRKFSLFASAMGVALIMITPEFMAQSAMQMTNMPMTVYASGYMLCLYLWFDKKGEHYFWLATILAFLGAWGRLEMLVFLLGGCLLILLQQWQDHKFQGLFKWANMTRFVYTLLPTIVLYVAWNIFLDSKLGVSDRKQGFTLSQIDGKIPHLWNLVEEVTFNTQYYGFIIYTFLILSAVGLVHILFIRKKYHPVLPVLATIFIIWFGYFLVYYLVDSRDKLENINIYITAGYKRGLFYFLPLMAYATLDMPIIRSLFDWLQPSIGRDSDKLAKTA